MKGIKGSVDEGGLRSPLMMKWPGRIKPGTVVRDIAGAIDLLPTLCRAAGIDWKSHGKGKPPIDGMDVWGTFLGNAENHPRSELLHWHGMESRPQALTQGDWKLFLDGRTALDGYKSGKGGSEQPPALFNIREDPDESEDLSQRHPEKAEALKARALELIAELDSSEKLEIATPE